MKTESYIRDTTDFVLHIESLNDKEINLTDVFLVTMDVVSLYPNISHQEGISACEKALEQRKVKSIPSSYITKLISFILTSISTEINQLQKLQNRAARIVTNSSYDTPGRPLIERLRWKTIQELIKIDSGTMVFKSLNGLAPQYLSSLFTRNSACSSRIRPFNKTVHAG